MNEEHLHDYSIAPGLKLFKSVIAYAELITERSITENCEEAKWEIMLLLSGYAVSHAYDSIPYAIEKFQKDFFPYLLEYMIKNGLHNRIEMDTGTFINSRFQLYNSELNLLDLPEHKVPSKLLFNLYEKPLQEVPGDSFDLTKSMMLLSVLIPSLKGLCNSVDMIIVYHYDELHF